VGIIGREGLSGFCALMGAKTSAYNAFMHVKGARGMRIDTDVLLSAIEQSPSLRSLLRRYVQTFIVQLTHGIISHVHHRLETRVARWLLMCHDRVDGDEILLTHEFLSMMIAAQRSGVTVSLQMIEGAGMIRSRRGRVTVVDREKLEDFAGEAYGHAEKEYRQLIGPVRQGEGANRSIFRPTSYIRVTGAGSGSSAASRRSCLAMWSSSLGASVGKHSASLLLERLQRK
jgi:DNA-binding transcriptional regulator YhcF (GntR family)